jgi:predicted RNA polymerase sigma factor
VPAATDLPARAAAVYDAIYAAYGTGWEDPAGVDRRRSGLADEAVRLAGIAVELLPDDPEAHGLLALLLHSRARRAARRSDDGRFVPLADQDPARWSAPDVERAEHHLTLALERAQLGRFQLHAAIQSVHNRRAATGATDWAAIARLYDGLVAFDPSVGTLVARAAAHVEADGPEAGRVALAALDPTVADGYQPYWVLRAELAQRAGCGAEATAAAERAVSLTHDDAVAAHVRQRYLTATR